MGDNRQIGIKCLKSEMRSLVSLFGDGRKIHGRKKYLHSASETWRDLNVIERSRAPCADRFPTHITQALTLSLDTVPCLGLAVSLGCWRGWMPSPWSRIWRDFHHLSETKHLERNVNVTPSLPHPSPHHVCTHRCTQSYTHRCTHTGMHGLTCTTCVHMQLCTGLHPPHVHTQAYTDFYLHVYTHADMHRLTHMYPCLL